MKKALYIALGTASALSFATAVTAAGTPAGTDVNNTATIGYATGGVTQANVNSNIATFKVDQKVNLTVAEVGGLVSPTSPGGLNFVTTFTVTNTSNATLDFSLLASQLASGQTVAFGGTDSFNQNNIRVFVDSNNNGIYDAGVDVATYVDELAADATRTVFIVSDTPAGQADASLAGVVLTATAAAGGTTNAQGSDLVQSAGADNPAVVDIVFADIAGKTDALRDGKSSADDTYKVVAPTLVLAKSSKIISDPFNGTTNPKRIPGATVEYCIVATNTGAGAANSAIISDNLASVSGVTYLNGSIFTGVTVSSGTCNTDGTLQTDAADGDQSNFSSNTVTSNLGTINGGASSAIRFRVTIN
ncbi:hypothetical protein GGQ97_001583 [Sphingomonas kaistensis]|uniref:DUF11 domain-containing protein n=2 Tax=Sphingomonas TaxID=13687 RepID=A0A7X5Y6N8_9SPHN|nr:hypothetical protein [Sphingomonas kaistensis]NJC05790.1 hypothetical protein [Sphingomonas kaistensis]